MPLSAESADRRQRISGAIVLFALAVSLVLLAGRLAHINTRLRDRLVMIAERQHESRTRIPARRGTIYDVRGRVVATSQLMPDVFIDPARATDLELLARELGARINVPAEEILEAVRRRPDSQYIVVARRIDEVTAQAVQQLRDPAVGLENRLIRTYPLGCSLAQVLGFVGRDGNGLDGLERRYDDHLSGTDGARAAVTDARRRALRRSDSLSTAPVDGGHLVLTIDAEIQRIAEDVLQDTVTEYQAESGVAIVMSPSDGDILAMVSLPTFDPNNLESGTADHRRNRAVTDPTEPGSTFKPFIACGALEGGFLTRTEQIDCRMGAQMFGRRLVKDVSAHGMMDLKGIVSKSSNIGMATIADRMGNEVLYDVIRRFGFGERTGIECPGEDPGVVRPLRDWNSYSTVSVSFGYEIGVTPIQLITAFSALLNDGVLYKPRLVREMLSPNGAALMSHFGPEVVRRAVPTDVARYIARDVLVAVVEEGSGFRAKTDAYGVLGKTGTAKLPYRNRRGYEPGAYLATFVGAAPLDAPAVAVLVMVRRPNPDVGYYGSTVSAPAVGTILARTLAYLEVPPDRALGWAGL